MNAASELDALLDRVPFARTLGMTLLSATPEEVHGVLGWQARLCTAGSVLHGGAVMAFADTVGAIVALLNLPSGATTATIESKTNFFRPITGGNARAHARPLHVGRGTIAVRTEIFDEGDRLAAHVVQTQAVLAGGTTSGPDAG